MLCIHNKIIHISFAGYREELFVEYLNTSKLTPIVKHYNMQIAIATDQTSCGDGVNHTKHFLDSLGRYGSTPFSWPMYGSGGLSQCILYFNIIIFREIKP